MYQGKVKRRYNNLNRLIIIILTSIGLGMDGYQTADSIFGLSVILWLWLEEINNLEANFVNKLSSVVSAFFDKFKKTPVI